MTVGAKMPVCTAGPIAVANLDQCYVLQHDGSFIDARSSCSLDSNGHSRRRIDILDSFKSFSNSEPMKAVFSKQKTDIFVWNNAVQDIYKILGGQAATARPSPEARVPVRPGHTIIMAGA